MTAPGADQIAPAIRQKPPSCRPASATRSDGALQLSRHIEV
jgi:hypothetical protein